MAEALSMPKTTLHRHFKNGELVVPETHAVGGQRQEASAVLSFANVVDGSVELNPMLDRVFLDEKWFYLRKVKNKFYLAPWETVPHQTTKNKRFIPSVMFLSVVARP
ncbi:hypothetical protein H257_07048 [Aphanomyces astaci]|uniref:Uncharacterized protein n=1 Tax=Aphanomyces astaci TaxID=112090 RepID=W4GJF6_APHAT|nr:hypothetical protein H257_07048 [Aphanomyces astaci]ETV79832.1 hypothetical protein H257_07048 [Aphanomyces astaci]|eukprot:XP_009830768.1 hypothetical protein H257_07048 [Aphanomyces astaci]